MKYGVLLLKIDSGLNDIKVFQSMIWQAIVALTRAISREPRTTTTRHEVRVGICLDKKNYCSVTP